MGATISLNLINVDRVFDVGDLWILVGNAGLGIYMLVTDRKNKLDLSLGIIMVILAILILVGIIV